MSSRLAAVFPRLRAALPARQWQALVEDFDCLDRSAHAAVTELAEAFLDYLDAEHRRGDDRLPGFAGDLAHFEWVRLSLAVDTPARIDGVDPHGDLLDAAPVLSPGVRAVIYDYPVHRTGAHRTGAHRACMPARAAAPLALLLQARSGGGVDVTEIDAVTLRLIELLDERAGATGRELLFALAVEIGWPQPEDFVERGLHILRELRARGVVLGVQAPPATAERA